MGLVRALPAPVKDASHIEITGVHWYPGESVTIEARLGTLDGADFVPEPGLVPFDHTFTGPALSGVLTRGNLDLTKVGAAIDAGDEIGRRFRRAE